MIPAELPSPLIAGHPFLPQGRGECIRAAFRAFKAAGLTSRIVDIYGLNPRDPDLEPEVGPYLAPRLNSGVNIFFINAPLPSKSNPRCARPARGAVAKDQGRAQASRSQSWKAVPG